MFKFIVFKKNMSDVVESINLSRSRSFLDRVNALSCIRFLIIFDLVLHAIKITVSGIVLYIKKDEVLHSQLKLFIAGYMVLCCAKGITFFSKNKSFFRINRIPDFEESSDISVISNLVEGCGLFWYILGFHWIQECENCAKLHSLIYYTSLTWLILGFVSFVAPLLAIVFLLILVTYIKPKMQTIIYRNEQDIPDGNTRCVICYENYRPGNAIKFLPCEHHFHIECIDEWFHVRDACPLCKRSVNILYDLIETADSAV